MVGLIEGYSFVLFIYLTLSSFNWVIRAFTFNMIVDILEFLSTFGLFCGSEGDKT